MDRQEIALRLSRGSTSASSRRLILTFLCDEVSNVEALVAKGDEREEVLIAAGRRVQELPVTALERHGPGFAP